MRHVRPLSAIAMLGALVLVALVTLVRGGPGQGGDDALLAYAQGTFWVIVIIGLGLSVYVGTAERAGR